MAREALVKLTALDKTKKARQDLKKGFDATGKAAKKLGIQSKKSTRDMKTGISGTNTEIEKIKRNYDRLRITGVRAWRDIVREARKAAKEAERQNKLSSEYSKGFKRDKTGRWRDEYGDLLSNRDLRRHGVDPRYGRRGNYGMSTGLGAGIGTRIGIRGGAARSGPLIAGFAAWKSLQAFGGVEDKQIFMSAIIAEMDKYKKDPKAHKFATNALSNQASTLGKKTMFKASDIVDAQLFATQAGFSVKQVLESTKAAVKIAAAGGTSVGEAMDVATSVMAAMGKNDLGSLADEMVNAFLSTKSNVQALGQGVKFVAASFKQAGYDTATMFAALGALNTAGLKGGMAGRNLNALTKSLLAPSKGMEKAILKATGKTWDENFKNKDGTLKSLEHIRGVFKDLMGGKKVKKADGTYEYVLTGEAAAPFRGMSGQAQRALGAMLVDSIWKTFENAKTKQLTNTGAADRISEARMTGLTGAIRKFTSNLEAAGIAAGNFLSYVAVPTLNTGSYFLGGAADKMSPVKPVAPQLIKIDQSANNVATNADKVAKTVDDLSGSLTKLKKKVDSIEFQNKTGINARPHDMNIAGEVPDNF